MAARYVGALVIGQAPRPDLTAPLAARLPQGWGVRSSGALDGVSAAEMPAVPAGGYPLATRLRDGTAVVLDEAFLQPRLQQALDGLEAAGVAATILLCAGTFASLHGRRPLMRPFAIGQAVLRALGLRSLGLIAPFEQQVAPIRQRWRAAGFAPVVWAADVTRRDAAFTAEVRARIAAQQLQCLVLDYVGHPETAVARLSEVVDVPVLDLGQLAMATLVATL